MRLRSIATKHIIESMSVGEAQRILGVGPGDPDLKKIYRGLVKKHHPDVGGTHDDMVKIVNAYDVLSAAKPSVAPPTEPPPPRAAGGAVGDNLLKLAADLARRLGHPTHPYVSTVERVMSQNPDRVASWEASITTIDQLLNKLNDWKKRGII